MLTEILFFSILPVLFNSTASSSLYSFVQLCLPASLRSIPFLSRDLHAFPSYLPSFLLPFCAPFFSPSNPFFPIPIRSQLDRLLPSSSPTAPISYTANMGIIYMPSPSDDVLTLILVNTALTVSILKQIVSSVLSYFGWARDGEPEDSVPVVTLTDLFRARFSPVQFGSGTSCRSRVERHVDCRVCLSRFKPESVVNRLPCGHVFHKGCLETWLDYQHATCPLCRTQLLGSSSSSSEPRRRAVWF